jgi:hypothetical protein
MFSNIPLKRLLLYVLLLGLLPLGIAVVHFLSQRSQLEDLRNQIMMVHGLAAARERKQAVNIAVRNNFRDADHFYIDKNLETLSFLQPEIEGLQKVMSNKNFPDDENIKKRFELLTSSSNNMMFTEGVVQSTPTFQEVTESLVHPIEVNVEDLLNILARIEGSEFGHVAPAPHRPQLIILDFKIEKKSVTEKNQVFVLNLKLLKREFL